MEIHGDTNDNLWAFMDEERKTINLPRQLSLTTVHHNHSSPEHHGGATNGIDTSTPWTLSPVRTSPTQPLLYHCITSLHRHGGNISAVALSGELIFTGSESNRVHAWKLPDCAEIGHVIKASSGQVRAMIVANHDSRLTLFTAHGDLKVRAWDVSSYGRSSSFKSRKIATLPAQRNPIMTSLFFSRKTVKKQQQRQKQHRDQISCMTYNQSDGLLYTGSWDRTVKAWKVNEKRCVDSFMAHEGQVNAIVLSQEDGCVFTCSSDGSVKIWRRLSGDSSHILTVTLKFQLSPVNALALSLSRPPEKNNGNYSTLLYSGSSDGIINFWEKEKSSGRYNHGGFIQAHHFSVLCLVAIGELVFSGSEDSTVRVWRRSEEGGWFHSCIAVVEGHRGPVRCLAVSVDESDERCLLVYSASLDQTLKVWRVKVFPWTEKEENGIDQDREVMCADLISPVLSPSWVEKKLQGNHF